MTETTIDKILGGRVSLEQPATGFRVAVDTILVAAAVPARAGQRILDMGCGVGGIMMALAARVAGCQFTGIEIQPFLADLCAANIARNGFGGFMEVRQADACQILSSQEAAFDHVALNPPYNDKERHTSSPLAMKRRANTDEAGELADWIEAAARALRDDGVLTLIHRGDRATEVAALCSRFWGEVRITPVMTKPEGPAKRILIRASKQGAGSIVQQPPFLLYAPEGDAVLRDAAAILDERN